MKTTKEQKEYMKKYYQANKAKALARAKKRRISQPSAVRNGLLMFHYNLSLEQYNMFLNAQNGKCAICCNVETTKDKRTGKVKNLFVDHDHSTGVVRGLLCGSCNSGLGYFKDMPISLMAAIQYLEMPHAS